MGKSGWGVATFERRWSERREDDAIEDVWSSKDNHGWLGYEGYHVHTRKLEMKTLHRSE